MICLVLLNYKTEVHSALNLFFSFILLWDLKEVILVSKMVKIKHRFKERLTSHLGQRISILRIWLDLCSQYFIAFCLYMSPLLDVGLSTFINHLVCGSKYTEVFLGLRSAKLINFFLNTFTLIYIIIPFNNTNIITDIGVSFITYNTNKILSHLK